MPEGFDREEVIIYKLGSIESKLDSTLILLNEHITKDDWVQEALDTRIKSLEISRGRLKGIAAAISAVIAVGVSYITKVFA